MRPITKGMEPAPLIAWKKRRTPGELTSWDSLKDEDGASLKSEIKALLLEEQGFVCCYCEQRIEVENSHIEHLASRKFHPKRTFDYSNLLACCLTPKQCGDLKGSKELKIHPLLSDCREYFHFTGDGRALPGGSPARSAEAKEAIDNVLGLGVNALRAQRRAAILGFTQALKGKNSDQALTAWAQIDARDAQGRNVPFASAIRSAVKPRQPASGPTQASPLK